MKTMKLSAFLVIILTAISGCERDPEDIILNKIPIANAGLSDTITLPVKSFTLSGSGSDSDGNVVAYLWSQVSGPDATVITNPGSAATAVDGFVQGTYVFRLTVTDDDGATGVDTMSVTVNPAVEKTVTIKPANNPNEKMLETIGGQDHSHIGGKEWVIDAWTVGGKSYTGRVVFEFDLNNIPATATVESANLFIYSNNPPLNGNLKDPNFGADNSMVLQQITANWSPETANWFNQPQTTTTNQVVIPATTQSVLDLNINVTAMVKAMVKNNSNHGFLMRLQNEVPYNSRMFVSSYHTEKPQQHPKLVVVYK